MSYEKEFDLMKEQAGITSNNLVYSDEIAKKAGIVKGNGYDANYVGNNFIYASGNTQQVHKETQEKLKEEQTNPKLSYEEIQKEKTKQKEVLEQAKLQKETEKEHEFEQQFENDFEKQYQDYLKQKESFEKEVQREKSEQEYEKRKLQEMSVAKSGYEEKTTIDRQIEQKEEKIERSNERLNDLSSNSVEKEVKEMLENGNEELADDFVPKNYGDAKNRKNYYVESFSHGSRSPQDVNEIDRQGIKEARIHEEDFDNVVGYARGYTTDKREIIRQEEMEAGVYYQNQNQRENDGGFYYK